MYDKRITRASSKVQILCEQMVRKIRIETVERIKSLNLSRARRAKERRNFQFIPWPFEGARAIHRPGKVVLRTQVDPLWQSFAGKHNEGVHTCPSEGPLFGQCVTLNPAEGILWNELCIINEQSSAVKRTERVPRRIHFCVWTNTTNPSPKSSTSLRSNLLRH